MNTISFGNNDKAIGVDVGGTKILVGTVNGWGEVLRQKKYPMDRSTQETSLKAVYGAIDDYTKEGIDGALALGMGLVGHVDYENGVWLSAMNIPIEAPENAAECIASKIGIPAALDNDVHSATLAEMRLGAGRKYDSFIYLNIGTGLSAGFVDGGKLIRGCANYAGECGHMMVEPDGEQCKCGNRGCMETIVSGGGIIDVANRLLPQFPDSALNGLNKEGKLYPKHIFMASESGDELAEIITNRAVAGLKIGLLNLVNMMNPEAVIFGGGVAADGWLAEKAQRHIAKKALPVVKKYFKGIFLSELDPDRVGLLGASQLAFEHIRRN